MTLTRLTPARSSYAGGYCWGADSAPGDPSVSHLGCSLCESGPADTHPAPVVRGRHEAHGWGEVCPGNCQ